MEVSLTLFSGRFHRPGICQGGAGRRGEGSVADRNRRFTLAAFVLPFLLIAMPGLGRAATITVNTASDPGTAAQCDLRDAISAAKWPGTGPRLRRRLRQ